MASFAWTAAQLTLMQDCLNARMSYREAAEHLRSKHKLKVTHNVIAGQVKRGHLIPTDEKIMGGRNGRTTAAEITKRLILIRQTFVKLGGRTTAPEISVKTGVSVNVVWRALKKLGLRTQPPERSFRARSAAKHRKRSKTKRQPRQYTDDPIEKIGVHFMDKRPNHCNFIIAKDPDDGLARYCCNRRLMAGTDFISAWCDEHHLVCHRIEYLEAAE